MGPSKFTRDAAPRRRPSPEPRKQGPRILVVCGAEETEEIYMQGLRSSSRNAATAIRVHKKARDPLSVVNYAISLKRANGRDFDFYWAILDVDDFDIGPAVQKAAAHGINLAISNPCFELWLILHFQDQFAHLTNFRAAKKIVLRHIEHYAKSSYSFAKLEPGLDDACRRAIALDTASSTRFPNPSSGMWALVLLIIGRTREDFAKPS